MHLFDTDLLAYSTEICVTIVDCFSRSYLTAEINIIIIIIIIIIIMITV